MKNEKPIQIFLSAKNHKKFKHICKKNGRTMSGAAAIIVNKIIGETEKENSKES